MKKTSIALFVSLTALASYAGAQSSSSPSSGTMTAPDRPAAGSSPSGGYSGSSRGETQPDTRYDSSGASGASGSMGAGSGSSGSTGSGSSMGGTPPSGSPNSGYGTAAPSGSPGTPSGSMSTPGGSMSDTPRNSMPGTTR